MSEKRFTLVGGKSKFNEILVKVYDNFEEEVIEKQKVVDLLNEQQSTIQSLKEENEKLRNIHLSIYLTYSYGYGSYLADVRVIDNE